MSFANPFGEDVTLWNRFCLTWGDQLVLEIADADTSKSPVGESQTEL